MKKIKNIFFWTLGILFIIIALGLFGGGLFISGIGMMLFGLCLITKIQNFIKGKYNISSLKYFGLAFLLFFISLIFIGIEGSNQAGKNLKVLEEKTKMDVKYIFNSIEENITSDEEIKLEITQNELKKLTINGKEIKIGTKKIIYNLPLEMGENNIIIKGINGEVERKSEKKIIKTTKEKIEEEKQKKIKEIETKIEKRIEESKKQIGIADKEKLNDFIEGNNLYIKRFGENKGIEDLKKVNEELKQDLEKIIKKESYKWYYFTDTDEMTDQIMKTAVIPSNNMVSQSFPYKETLGYLQVRKKGGQLDIIFRIDNGQILNFGKTAKLRFDDKEAFNVNLNGSSDYDSTVVFLKNEKTILNNLKTAKKLKLQIELYQEGLEIFEFDVEGLEI